MRYSIPTKRQSDNILSKQHQSEMEEVHAVCFAKLCEVIDRKIIIGKKVMKLTDLRSLYCTYLSETPFANPNYRSEKIKSILNGHEVYSNKLCFVSLGKIQGQYQLDLVFSDKTDLSEAVKHGYLLGCSDKIQDVAILLHKMIKNAFEKAEKLPWPPTASCLTTKNPAPSNLQRFLRILISGKAERSESERIVLLVSSIGQDLCQAATKSQWKLPKHILVCMTLRHLFRSAKLSILMNRLGHSESYSFSLELEIALIEALEKAHTIRNNNNTISSLPIIISQRL